LGWVLVLGFFFVSAHFFFPIPLVFMKSGGRISFAWLFFFVPPFFRFFSLFGFFPSPEVPLLGFFFL